MVESKCWACTSQNRGRRVSKKRTPVLFHYGKAVMRVILASFYDYGQPRGSTSLRIGRCVKSMLELFVNIRIVRGCQGGGADQRVGPVDFKQERPSPTGDKIEDSFRFHPRPQLVDWMLRSESSNW